MFWNRIFICLIIFNPFFYVEPSTALSSERLLKFSENNPKSRVTLDYSVWSQFLDGNAINVGRSKRQLGQAPLEYFSGMRISYNNPLPSRFEGNRVFYSQFTDEHRKYLEELPKELEGLANTIPLNNLNKDEQLAFWLNLYNVLVVSFVSDHYPKSKLKGFRFGDSTKNWWTRKVVTILGTQLSLEDIEQVLLENWGDPLIIYGLYQGSIGGPSLPLVAFKGQNVFKQLEESAIEFINSNRGIRRVKDGEAKISKFYEWYFDFFKKNDQAIINHLNIYYEMDWDPNIETATSVKFIYYDWRIADLIGGQRYGGGYNSTPPAIFRFLQELPIYNDTPFFTPIITSEECAPGEKCPATNQPEEK